MHAVADDEQSKVHDWFGAVRTRALDCSVGVSLIKFRSITIAFIVPYLASCRATEFVTV